MKKFNLKDEHIALFQLLKATRLCATGGEAKIVISEGLVKVGGKTETRLRKKIRSGQTVTFNGETVAVEAS